MLEKSELNMFLPSDQSSYSEIQKIKSRKLAAELEKSTKKLKNAILLYFYLLIFEGALRKWVLPSLAEPLLIVRDPVAMYIIYLAYHKLAWKPNFYVNAMWAITALGFVVAILVGHGNPVVALYGARITIIHFPLIFIIGQILSRNDVIKIGKIMLWLTIGMTLLVAIQFFSPQSSWVNRGLGGDLTGSGFAGAGGFYRVPGTFSFTNGLSNFYGFAVAFIAYFWFSGKENTFSKYLLIASTIAVAAAIPLTISRTVVFCIALSLTYLLIIAGRKPKLMIQIIGGIVGALCLFLILSNFSFFQVASGAFVERFTGANENEGGIEGVFLDRFLGGMISGLVNGGSAFFGVGLGMGTNAGAKILTGSAGFLVSEGEWGRVMGEMGFFLGMLMIILRINLTFSLIKRSWGGIGKNNYLPWLLMSFGLFPVLQGQWAQPTSLGFSVLLGGLVVAGLKNNGK